MPMVTSPSTGAASETKEKLYMVPQRIAFPFGLLMNGSAPRVIEFAPSAGAQSAPEMSPSGPSW